MIITSRFASACRSCRRAVAAGDRVDWTRGTKGVLCGECSPELAGEREAIEASRAEVSDLDVPAPEGLNYLPYQRAGIAAMLAHREGSLLADEMGLGKTIQIAGLLNAGDYPRVLVVAPKSLVLNWMRELGKWLVEPRLAARIPSDARAKASIVVGTYEEAKKYAEELAALDWSLFVIDEIHYCKNAKTQRAKAVAAIAGSAERVVGLTGTPIVNKPKELFPLLKIVAPEAWDPKGKGFFRFAKRYCGAFQKRVSRTRVVWDFNGATNLDELQERLRGSCMVRRLKADVLTELPAKRRQLIELEVPGCVALLREEQAAAPGLATASEEEYEAAVAALRSDKAAFVETSRIRVELAKRALPTVLEHVSEFLEESSEKVIIGAHHHAVIDALGEELERFGVVVVTGKHSAEQRQAAVDAFQDGSPRVFIGQIQAAGVGLTLTASSTVMLVELPWTPGEASQFEDRAHRIGQGDNVLVQHLVVAGSLQAHQAKIIMAKQAIADAALDARPAPRAERPVVAPKEAKPRSDKQRAIDAMAELITPEMRAQIHGHLRLLAGHCDGARELDGAGFSRIDAEVGHELAAESELTPRQAALGLTLCRKYRRQLADFGVDALLSMGGAK